MKDMIRLCGGQKFTVHGCMHELRYSNSGSKLQLKPWRWISSIQRIRRALELPGNHLSSEHKQIQGGRRAAQSAIYPVKLRRRFAKALLKEVSQGEVKAKSQPP